MPDNFSNATSPLYANFCYVTYHGTCCDSHVFKCVLPVVTKSWSFYCYHLETNLQPKTTRYRKYNTFHLVFHHISGVGVWRYRQYISWKPWQLSVVCASQADWPRATTPWQVMVNHLSGRLGFYVLCTYVLLVYEPSEITNIQAVLKGCQITLFSLQLKHLSQPTKHQKCDLIAFVSSLERKRGRLISSLKRKTGRILPSPYE